MVIPLPNLRIAILVKQVPRFEAMQLRPDGRLQREGLELELNPYCRRAVAKGVELAREHGAACTVFTLGPPSAEDILREAVAWGAHDAVLITDPAFAGSDTLATARALATALQKEGPFDLVLAGRNSVDADTGQVGPEVAELLDFSFLGGVRELEVDRAKVHARCEYDDGWVIAEATLPALVSCAERLCEPAKAEVSARTAVATQRIRRLNAGDLGGGPWGSDGSPTRVGDVRVLEVERARKILAGPIEHQVRHAVEILVERGGFAHAGDAMRADERVPATSNEAHGPVVAALLERDRPREARELLGSAAALAARLGGSVAAVHATGALPRPDVMSSWGADEILLTEGSEVAEDVARAIAAWCEARRPWGLIVSGTMWGREVASRIAARLGAGLTGDAVDLSVEAGRMIAWKPAFGGRLVAAIHSESEVQLATVRPGILALRSPRGIEELTPSALFIESRGRIHHLESRRDDELDDLARAAVVVGVGLGVQPAEYDLLQPLLTELGAELAATRKVTDNGWLPRSRQVGITGRSISPTIYVAVGMSGKFNHMVGVRGAGVILAINADRNAPVFDNADIGIVADWHEVVPLLLASLSMNRTSSVDGARQA